MASGCTIPASVFTPFFQPDVVPAANRYNAPPFPYPLRGLAHEIPFSSVDAGPSDGQGQP
ncbi:hypothetical protein PSEUDO8BK_30182 [Pseudomonas sp. 8BK]|nr:hypothetical protein PSEUDO8BK_30182 [Pseudomonas sp. 8BK]